MLLAIQTGEAAEPLPVPPLQALLPADEALLRDCGEALAQALAHSLRGLTGQPVSCEPETSRVVEAGSPPTGVTCWTLQWGEPGPRWCLSLPSPAIEDLVAALLGFSQLDSGHPVTDTDRALLELLAATVAGETSRALTLPPSVSHSILPPDERPSPLSAPVAELTVRLSLGERRYDLPARVSWPALAARRVSAVGSTKLDPRLLSQAEVDVEAMLPGPELTAHELLSLQPGDVITLGMTEQDAVLVAGVPIGRGRAGARAGRLAISIREISSL